IYIILYIVILYLTMIIMDYRLYINPDINTLIFLIAQDIEQVIIISKKDFIELFQQFYNRSSTKCLRIHTLPQKNNQNIIIQISYQMISDIIDDLLPTLEDE
ncbi:MAG: hypothetical protein WD512_15635, partial [Candidatus Paceibacterota bacterium]